MFKTINHESVFTRFLLRVNSTVERNERNDVSGQEDSSVASFLPIKCVISSGEICLDKFSSREILPCDYDNTNSKISPLRSFLAPVEMTRYFISFLTQRTASRLRMTSGLSFAICRLFVICFLLFVISAPAQSDALANRWLAANKVEAPSYILMDLDSGRILAQKNAHQRREPASTTKIMTALLAIESGKLDQSFTIGRDPPKIGESSMNLEQGEVFSLGLLVQATLTKSANDGAVAIAEAVSGTAPKFVELMNLKAKQLGCHDTHFANPDGLHNPDHYTTASDLATIARAALNHPFFDTTVRIKEITLHGNKKVRTRVYYNHNRLLTHWDKCDGVKTGYTRQAGRCLVASATETDAATGHKWRLLSVVLHAPNSWSDSINLLQHHGFDKFHPTRVAAAGKVLTDVKIKGGQSDAEAVATEDLWLPLRKDEKTKLQTKIHPLERAAPVEKGQIVAYMAWTIDGHKIAAMPLVAKDSVDRSTIHRAMSALTVDGPIYKSPWVWVGLALLLILAIVKVNIGKRKRKSKARAKRKSREW